MGSCLVSTVFSSRTVYTERTNSRPQGVQQHRGRARGERETKDQGREETALGRSSSSAQSVTQETGREVDATRMTGVREAAGLLRARVDGKGEEDGTGWHSMHSTSGVFHNNEIRCATCGIGAHLSGG